MNRCIYIVDSGNNRVLKWKFGAKSGQIVAGGNGEGCGMNQLFEPSYVMAGKKTDSLIICDKGNQRVIQWSLPRASIEKILISDIHCSALATDKNGDFYVSNYSKNDVRQWKVGKTLGNVVAGENGIGYGLHQLHYPTHLFVDDKQSVYVMDTMNHRVVKWLKGAREGIVVAGDRDEGNDVTQLHLPKGMIVDQFGDIYIADYYNHRIVCWPEGSKEGHVIVSGNGEGARANQLSHPCHLSFDREGHLYVADTGNHRIQKFEIDQS